MGQLSGEQHNIARTAISVAKARTRKLHPTTARTVQLALLSAGLVESNLRNLSHGDRDSQGYLQQRPSQGWGSVAQVRNVTHATEAFLNSALPLAEKYKGRPGALAQAVQRSGFPGRYSERMGEASQILDSIGGTMPRHGATPPSGAPGSTTTTATATSTQEVVPTESAGTGVADLIRQEVAARRQGTQIQASSPAPPPFSAGPRMPRGLQGGVALPSLGAPAAASTDSIDSLLEQARGQQGADVPLSVSATSRAMATSTDGGQAPAPRGGGKGPVAGRAWGGSKNIVASVARPIAAAAGLSVTSTKRTPGHNASVGGDPHSDHLTTARNSWAEDYGTNNGAAVAAKIARAYGIKGWQPNSYTRYTIRARGGQRYSVQILWGAGVGHGDHVHVGIRRA